MTILFRGWFYDQEALHLHLGAQTRSVEVKLDLKREPEAEAGKTQRKRARTSKKAFDTVLDEEDRNGAVVVNAAHTAGRSNAFSAGQERSWDFYEGEGGYQHLSYLFLITLCLIICKGRSWQVDVVGFCAIVYGNRDIKSCPGVEVWREQ